MLQIMIAPYNSALTSMNEALSYVNRLSADESWYKLSISQRYQILATVAELDDDEHDWLCQAFEPDKPLLKALSNCFQTDLFALFLLLAIALGCLPVARVGEWIDRIIEKNSAPLVGAK